MTVPRRTRRTKKRPALVLLLQFLLVAARLLPYGMVVASGRLFGRVAYRLLRRERTRAFEHLRIAFPGRDETWVRRTAAGAFRHLGTALLETVSVRPGRLPALVTINGLENLERASAQGRGTVFVTGHMGNWELLAGAVAQRYPVSVIAAPLKPEPLNDMISGLRARLGVRTIIRSRSGASKELIRVFRENRVLGILIDQDTDVDGAFVDFFGRPAWTPTAAVQMAIRFDAPVVYGAIHRGQDGRHVVDIEGPIELLRTGNDADDLRQNTARLTKLIENTIIREPEQWVWMHRRWRRRP